MMIERIPVDSSNISSVGFDKDTGTLAVEFKSGGVYHYHNVPKTIYDEFLADKSQGSHFHKNIKNQYKYTKQDDK